MTHIATRWVLIGLVTLVTPLSGCARWIDLQGPDEAIQASIAYAVSDQDRVPLIVERFHRLQNGAAHPVTDDLERRVLHEVQDTRLFSALVPFGKPGVEAGEKTVIARITFHETVEPHAGEAAWKGFVIGASMFLLSPFLELEYDYTAKASVELERWDGAIKRYEAGAAGTARYQLFGAHPLVIEELKDQVTEACLRELTDQLVRDTPFYMAGGTPLPAGGTRMITVKTRKPTGAVPISTVISE